ncbi:FAD-dependent oxidoreductase [Thermodesulfobacteriota bacterium]
MLKHLFTPFRIKNLQLENRIVMPGLASFLFEKDGSVTDKTVEHYRRRAAGGPAMVILEASAVAPEGIVSRTQARIYDDRFTDGLARIARAMKAEGAIPAIQLHHGGRQTSAGIIKQKPVSPSNLPCPMIKGEVEPLTIKGIGHIIHQFGEAATRALDAGYELIEIHGAHGYLVNQFLSRFSNVREDKYGGSLSGRTRFAREIIREVRSRVGDAFPLSFKISAQEFVPDGIMVEESIELLKELIREGLDAIQVSAGNDATPEWISQPMFMEKGCLADSAEKIKKAIKLPVMAVGRINDPLLAADIISKGKADLVCIGRGMLADPEMPKKVKEGQLDDIRTCIACNTCMQSIFRIGRVECLVNPTLGREKEMEIIPAAAAKKVMVIGGGPAGMDAAWVASKRGHEVHLYERQSAFGGQLLIGSVPSHKKELLNLVNFLERQLHKHGVTCHRNLEVTLDRIKALNPDVVVLATGSIPITPTLPGIEKSIVTPLTDILNGGQPEQMATIVIGGGATGCEVALHLAENGNPVTIIEQLPAVGRGMEAQTKIVLLRKLQENNVRILTRHQLSGIEDDGIHVLAPEGNERFFKADRVVMAVGNRPENHLYDQIKALGLEVHLIGDCVEARSAKAAIYEGAVVGRII